ncbi:MAG: TatD family hydrolase [Bacilli bacterium]|nr:TatD family hydrolase [Bacilli bacterium]
MFIDTHCHLSIEDYDNIDEVINENRKSNIDKIIISGCTKESIIESLDLASRYDDVFVTIGYHPSETDKTNIDDLKFLEEKLSDEKVVGIGEIGLDYHYGKENIEKQKELFIYQLDLATKYDLPVVIHSRDATQDTIDILKQYNLKGDIHCFSGSLETAKIYINMGYYLGIGGVVTFKNSNLYKVIIEIGIDNIILETDSPYLSPEPLRGTKNSSKNIPIIAKKIADTLGTDINEVSRVTSSNAINLFDL